MIVEKVNDVVMKIQKSNSAKPRIVHVDRLKLVEGTVDTSWYKGEKMKHSVETGQEKDKSRREPRRQLTVMEEMGLVSQ